MNNQLRDRLLHTCTWCLKLISEDDDRFAYGVKASEAVDLTGREGEFVSFNLALKDKTVVALVTAQASQARKQGFDLIFLTCSQDCAEDLKDTLDLERDVIQD